MHTLLTLSLWILAWLLWSGLYQPLLITLGVLSSLLVLYLARRMGFFEGRVYSLHLIARLVPFWGWLGGQLIRSNLEVARIVLSPRMAISPTVVRLRAEPPGPVGQAILGNAITLTPGTVTIDDHDGVLFVHCLTREGARALLDCGINQRVAALIRS